MTPDFPAAPRCSVVVCTRDRPEYLDRCLNALAGLDYPCFETVVVDNAPSDGRTRELADRRKVRYLVEPAPGLSRARNRGALESTGEIVAYLDDDAIAEPGWLGGLAAEFSDPRVMAVTGRVLPLEPADEEGRKCALIAGADHGPQRRVFDRATPLWFRLANFGGIGIGANMALRAAAFSVLHGFNPRLGRGAVVPACEENYAFFELIDRDYRVVYTPAAIVRHHAPQTLDELREALISRLVEAGAYLSFLLMERPDYRLTTLKFIFDGFSGARNIYADQSAAPSHRIAPRWRELYAGLRGALLYACARLRVRLDRPRWTKTSRDSGDASISQG